VWPFYLSRARSPRPGYVFSPLLADSPESPVLTSPLPWRSALRPGGSLLIRCQRPSADIIHLLELALCATLRRPPVAPRIDIASARIALCH
jgi:hypothetical protein